MTILNCTPHTVTIINPETCTYVAKSRSYIPNGSAEIIKTFEPSGIIPRCATKETRMADIDGIRCIGIEFGAIENLPEKKLGTFLIVSAIVAAAGRKLGRDDLLVPSEMVRDEKGNIIGCLSLAIQ